MKCPACKKGEIREDIGLIGVIFSRKKRLIAYCPICDFKNVREFDISEAQYHAEINKKAGVV